MKNARVGGVYLNGHGSLIMVFKELENPHIYKIRGFNVTMCTFSSYAIEGRFFPTVLSSFDLIEEVYYSKELANKLIEATHHPDALINIFNNEVKLCQ